MKRSTVQRKLTLEAVNSLHCHATVEEVYAEVSKEHPSVSRATVYRNLKDLSDSGEIRRINNAGGADRFDHIVEKHYHVRCDKCGKLFDVDMPYMGELQEN
ncbi:MAG: transcriptional repressor, partial [Clostridia bacterium]|nr:transcriptional repressor [Clostridia bacterium]